MTIEQPPLIFARFSLNSHAQLKFEVNRTKIKGECRSETKVAELISNSELPLAIQSSQLTLFLTHAKIYNLFFR